MASGQFQQVSFEDFKARHLSLTAERSDKTPEEIEAEMIRVVAAYEGR